MITENDRSAIAELAARYFWAVDRGDVDSYLATWAADGISEAAYGTARGHAELRARFDRMQETGFSRGKRHVISNLVIDEVRPGEARAAVYLTVIDRESSPPRIVATATYEDLLVRDGADWRFRRRVLTLDPGYRP